MGGLLWVTGVTVTDKLKVAPGYTGCGISTRSREEVMPVYNPLSGVQPISESPVLQGKLGVSVITWPDTRLALHISEMEDERGALHCSLQIHQREYSWSRDLVLSHQTSWFLEQPSSSNRAGDSLIQRISVLRFT